MLLTGKNALVTGGSRGIGRAIVLAFLREGASVWFVATRPSEHMEEYEKQARESGGRVVFKRSDVSDEAAIGAVVEEVAAEAGRIDILVNNAGITRDGLVFRMSTQDWEDVIRTNLTSAFFTTRTVARQMIRQRSGAIINVSSIVGVIGNAGQTNYAASKAGLIGFSKSLAREVASRGVRVNVVAPGFIETSMTEKLSEEQRNTLFGQIPLGRIGTPDETASAVLFLASDLSSYITGHVLLVDGGMGM